MPRALPSACEKVRPVEAPPLLPPLCDLRYPPSAGAVFLELNVLRNLNHKNVVTLVGVCAHFPSEQEPQSNFNLGMVLDLCSTTMQDFLKRGHAKWETKRVIADGLLQGMCYLQGLDIIHRDLSSQNVLLKDNFVVKIADFGCARRVGPAAALRPPAAPPTRA